MRAFLSLAYKVGQLPNAHPAALSLLLLLLNRTRGENETKKFGVKIKTGRLVTNYHPWQKRLDLGRGNECNSLPIKIQLHSEK